MALSVLYSLNLSLNQSRIYTLWHINTCTIFTFKVIFLYYKIVVVLNCRISLYFLLSVLLPSLYLLVCVYITLLVSLLICQLLRP